MKEIWKPIKDFSNYKISNLGNVYSISSQRLLRPCANKNRRGYVYVSVQQDGKRKNYLLSRLVAEHFIPNPGGKTQVNHIDGNKQNNAISNLEWVTNMENLAHAHKNNLMPTPYEYAMTSKKRKINLKDVLRIRQMAIDGVKHKEIAKMFSLGQSTVTHIVNGTRWAWIKEGVYHERLGYR